MTPTQIGILVAIAGFIAVGIFGFWRAVRIPWPSGARMTRTSALGCRVIVIDAPGTDGEKLLLLDACTAASVAIFTAWRVWRPNDVDVARPFSEIGVHFIDDSLMDDIGHALFDRQRVRSYLSDASSKSKKIPLAVIRKSLAVEMIGTGQPLMHEMLHALLTHFLPNVAGNKEHTHVAWDFVQGAARTTFLDLYAPKQGRA